MNVLYLNLKKKYFDQILQGTKKYEYREVKEFFIKRLQGKNYDFVKFSNGYSKNAPYFSEILPSLLDCNPEFFLDTLRRKAPCRYKWPVVSCPRPLERCPVR